MSKISDLPEPVREVVKTRAVALLLVAPACSIALVVVLYLMLYPRIPQRVAIHVGPDGVGYGSTPLMVAITCAIAAVAFAIGGATARGFLKADHWYQTEKSIAIVIESLGYGVIGVALATIFSTVGVDPNEVSGNSVAMGLLGFLVMFIVSACVYVAALPRGKMETLG